MALVEVWCDTWAQCSCGSIEAVGKRYGSNLLQMHHLIFDPAVIGAIPVEHKVEIIKNIVVEIISASDPWTWL